MKVRIQNTFLVLFLTGLAFSSYGQEQKVQKPGVLTELQRQKQERNFYRKTLQVDSVKALQVSQVQHTYKTALKAAIADTSLNEAAKRARISTLMESKNQQLRSLLSPIQQQKIIPTTERIPSKPSKQL